MTIKENVYGHRKRLNFIKEAILNYLHEKNLEKNQINILDVGCGTGVMITNPLASMGYNILGIDLDKESITIANRHRVKKCQFQNIPIESLKNKYDIIICSEVLEHLDYPEKLLKEIIKRLKKNGFCIITVPNGYGGFEIDDFFWKLFKLDKIFYPKPQNINHQKRINKEKQSRSFCQDSPHVQHFTLKQINKIFNQSGFKILDQKGSVPFSGKFSHLFFRNNKFFINFNLFLGKYLPIRLLSGWYFILHKDNYEIC